MMRIDNDFYSSRFIKKNDIHSDMCIFEIPDVWWSRKYEYPWAMKFSDKDDVCLDAACGIEHHLKFWLARECKKVYCCDLDERILNKKEVLSLAKENCNLELYKELEHYTNNIDFKCSGITETGYNDNMFDKVYCISVLEHLDRETFIKSFMEFKRILKDDGKIILTFDYPTVNLSELKVAVDLVGLKFYDQMNFEVPKDVLISEIYKGLMCFRAVLTKK